MCEDVEVSIFHQFVVEQDVDVWLCITSLNWGGHKMEVTAGSSLVSTSGQA